MKKVSVSVFLFFALTVLYIVNTSSSGGRATVANSGNSGAPGETPCTGCHGGSFGQTSINLTITKNGQPVTAYMPDTTYDMSIVINNTSGSPARWGFQITALRTPSNTAISGWSNFPANVVTITLSNSRTYVEQSPPVLSNTINLKWKAPAAGSGNVTFYFAGVAGNGSGNSGDGAAANTRTITEMSVLSLGNATVNNVNCYGGNTGSISLSPTGGTTPYTYNWSNGANSSSISNLTAGTYNVTVSDNGGQSATQSFTITQPAAALSISGATTNVTCNGAANGSINITPTGGNNGYNYNWGGGITTEDRTNLPPGTYTVTVTDSKGCTATSTYTITQPAALSPSATAANNSCVEVNNGSVDVTVTGGTGPYNYNWSNGATTQDISNLPAGTYNLTITDANNCSTTISRTITAGTGVTLSSNISNPSCNGAADGAINVTVQTGTSPVTFAWSNSSSSEDLSNISAGVYSITATDAAGCTTSATFNVSEASTLDALSSVTNVTCAGGNNGAVAVTATGGTSPYTFNWNTGSTQSSLSGLQAGSYTITITDINNCNKILSVQVTEPTALSISGTVSNVSCFGSSTGAINATASGGTPGYTFAWSNNSSSAGINNIGAGSYSLTVQDANLCTAVQNFTITEPDSLTVSGTVTNATSNTAADGSITLSIAGGTAPYTFMWSNGGEPTSLTAGNYTVTVTDANQCSTTAAFTVSAPTSVTAIPESGFTLYPNPAREVLYINIADATTPSATVNLYNATGVLIKTIETATPATPLSLNGIPAGLYVAEVLANNKATRFKLLIQP